MTFWRVMDEVVQAFRPQADNSDYDLRIRITAVHTQPAGLGRGRGVRGRTSACTWQHAADSTWMRCASGLARCGERRLRDRRVSTSLIEAARMRPSSRLSGASRRRWKHWVMNPDRNGVYWVEAGANPGRHGRASRCASAPLHVGPLVQEHILFQQRHGRFSPRPPWPQSAPSSTRASAWAWTRPTSCWSARPLTTRPTP